MATTGPNAIVAPLEKTKQVQKTLTRAAWSETFVETLSLCFIVVLVMLYFALMFAEDTFPVY